MNNLIHITTTSDQKKDLGKIAKIVLDNQLAACVQVLGPITSSYYWQEELRVEEEYQCLIKSREDKYEEIEEIIKENHSYELPEIIVTPILDGSPEYINWLHSQIK